jgi:hypothetical protein
MRAWIFFIAIVFAFGSVPLFPAVQWAQQTTSQQVVMTWSFRSNHPKVVFLQLYAQYSKDKTVWPGRDQYYKLDDSEAHVARIKCWEGELICYGAWTGGGPEWGTGPNNKRGCKDCCVTCSRGDKGTRNLNPS